MPRDELLDRFGLGGMARRQTGGLSGGQRRRLAVALAFVGRPRMVFLDEPTTGLDVQARRELWEGIRSFHADGGTVLLTSHYLEEVEALAQRVIVLGGGRVLADDTVAAVKGLVDVRRVSLTAAALPPLAAVVSSEHNDGRFHLLTDRRRPTRPGSGGAATWTSATWRFGRPHSRRRSSASPRSQLLNPPCHRPPSEGTTVTLALVNARYLLLETVRIPVALIGTMFFPAASMLFFVVPFAGDNPIGATFATASMVTFAVMTTNLFQYGVGVAEDRAQPWDPYTRTLPAGPGPRFAGRILAGLLLMFASFLPVVAIAAIATAATASPAELALAAGAVIVIAVPFTLMGLAIGYALPSKAALAVAQLLFFPLAFCGGLLSAPGEAPGWVEAIAPYLPTRGAVELMWAAVGDFTPDRTALFMLVAWTVAMALLAVWAYRRDEGRRFH